jgi:hypothetical protein
MPDIDVEQAPMKPVQDLLTACLICEGQEEADEDRQLEAWQYLIDTGVVWQLQGTYGRMARSLIEDGLCTPATHHQ